ncbi:hypothetical protein [Domibacillus mangrovi]|uniref:Uncharacterized protein n=1 Tax=Domibacillus mangrovi TaxID=1714354 RepID=A0A1Q5P446_9BACI|nr:hypothetical protein [Domibacillus mangrovi]OKL36911.1 hypothetical protein BLL40_09360 [Domibacillus mangrovi]
MTPITDYEHLTDAEGDHKHLSSLQSSDDRDQYRLGNVVEVKSNPQLMCIVSKANSGNMQRKECSIDK